MRKDEFFRQLEYLLQDIPETDRNEAINYYWDYLEEAGPENEEQVLNEFGSPERIAAIIRSDIIGNLEDGGSFTEKGYEDERFRDPNYQLAKRFDLPEEQMGARGSFQRDQGENPEWKSYDADYVHTEERPKPRTSGCLKLILCAILLVVAAPVIFGVGGTAFGVVTAVIVVAAVMFFLVGLLTLIFLFTGLVLVITGLAAVFQDPVEAVFVIGLGLLFVGLGLLALILSVWFYGKLIPWVFKGVGKGIDAVSDRVRRRR